MEATVEVAVVMEAAAGARWRTESPAVGGNGRGLANGLHFEMPAPAFGSFSTYVDLCWYN